MAHWIIEDCGIENKPAVSFNPALFMTHRSETIRAYDEMETTLISLTGYDMKKLIELFAAGYTLQPPTSMHLEDLAKKKEVK